MDNYNQIIISILIKYLFKKINKILKLPNKAEICMVINVGKKVKNGIYSKRFRLDSKYFIKIV